MREEIWYLSTPKKVFLQKELETPSHTSVPYWLTIHSTTRNIIDQISPLNIHGKGAFRSVFGRYFDFSLINQRITLVQSVCFFFPFVFLAYISSESFSYPINSLFFLSTSDDKISDSSIIFC